MTDRAELILAELVTAAETTGYTVDIDRFVPLGDDEAPIAIIRTGEEDSIEVDALLIGKRWSATYGVELYVSAETPAAARAALAAAWASIIGALSAPTAPIRKLVTQRTPIEISKMNIVRTGRFFAWPGSISLTFDR